MADDDDRKHVPDYTHVDLIYVEDQVVSKYNLLKEELSLHISELSNLKNTVSINCSFQNEVIRINLENKSLKDEISDLKQVIEKWTCSKVTLDQLLFEQVLGNIVKALGGRRRRKEKISTKEVIFSKADESSSEKIPEITSDSESDCEAQEPLPPLPKLIGAEPACTPNSLISLVNLTHNMADLTLGTSVTKKTKPTCEKVSPAYVIKKKTKRKSPVVPDKKADSSTEQLLLTLIEEVKELKMKIKTPLDTSPSNSHAIKKAPKIPKPFKEYKYCGFNDHHSDNYEYYPGCEVCGSIANEPVDCPKRYSKEPGPKVVFGDDSSGDTEGYGSVNCNGITFTRVAYVNGLKHNLIRISQLCDANFKGISQNFSSPCTPEQNEVVEKRNRTLIEAATTMLNSAKLPKQFWGEAVNIACLTQNRSIIVKRHRKTTYDVFRGRSTDISYFHWPKLSEYSTSEDKKWRKMFMSHSVKTMKQFLNPALKEMKSASMKIDLS
ncbi:retrovirus-related pol polyprotein from transposon TNT 1-94 [Tanacetum coccineum]|uniref:Retrovirus-related pol polyprotein from transposon TNT 1-94 n=1 Tax=Tanacetum coccineum TaxID=301880 RepID=A0ABQ4WPU1_9ASTR